MAKRFNVIGTCIPGKHFMGDTSGKIEQILQMVSDGDYFTINRPRQFGKTTLLNLLEKRLVKEKDYLVLAITFEGIDTPTYERHDRFIENFLNLLNQELELKKEQELADMIAENKKIENFGVLSTFLSRIIHASGRKAVLMIDEVDKSGNNQLFLDFLGMLRSKYLNSKNGKDITFHSVVLTGVHDVKNLKNKIRPGDKKTFNSPWNIAVDFEVDISLSPAEIAVMLDDYTKEKPVVLDIDFFAKELFYYTSGYPFLVSYLCKLIDENILPKKAGNKWEPTDLIEAVKTALLGENSNFENVIKNLENNPSLYDLVFNIVMNEKEFTYNPRNSVIQLGKVHGILKNEKGRVRIHNRMYEQLIYDYMSSNLETSGAIDSSPVGSSFLAEDGTLDIEKVIHKFQEFMEEQYNKEGKEIDIAWI